MPKALKCLLTPTTYVCAIVECYIRRKLHQRFIQWGCLSSFTHLKLLIEHLLCAKNCSGDSVFFLLLFNFSRCVSFLGSLDIHASAFPEHLDSCSMATKLIFLLFLLCQNLPMTNLFSMTH